MNFVRGGVELATRIRAVVRALAGKLSAQVRTLPTRPASGWGDLFLQFFLFFIAYQSYQLVRGISDGQGGLALANADRIIHIERSLGSFFEPDLQQALLNQHWLVDGASWLYLNSHFVLTVGFLAWLYLFRHEHFRFVRNMFMVAMALALVGYALYPTAPPRLSVVGVVDTVSVYTGVHIAAPSTHLFYNAYAAVPSMHVCFALLIAVPGFALSRTAWARGWWSAYPMLVFFAVVITGNHFWLDAAAGAAVACLAAVTARQLARVGPASWAWQEVPQRAPA